MRLSSLTLTLGMWIIGTAHVGASSAGLPHEIIDAMDGQRLVMFLRSEDVAASPSWQPERQSTPPLTIAQALTRLKNWMSKDPRYQSAGIARIELKPMHEHEKEHRWYFLVRLRQPGPGAAYVAILMNGKVVPVIAEPEAIK